MGPNPQTVLLEKEAAAERTLKANSLLEAIDGEAELEELYQEIEKGYDKPRYLAEQLNTSIEDINNRLKRLRRRAKALEKKGTK